MKMLKYLALLCAGLMAATFASAAEWKAGENYFVIEPPQPTATGSRIEVLEVFSYACPHCANFQPHAEQIRKSLPSYAAFRYMPAVFQPVWEPFARAFYAAESLGVLDRTHQALFDALYVKRVPLRTLDDLAGFYAEHGVDRAKFLSAANSFEVESKLARAREIVAKDGIDGTPSIVVQGKYRATGASAGSYEKLVELVDWLVRKAHAEQQKGADGK
jgi:thiol:disulfide interchange protein DsbA